MEPQKTSAIYMATAFERFSLKWSPYMVKVSLGLSAVAMGAASINYAFDKAIEMTSPEIVQDRAYFEPGDADVAQNVFMRTTHLEVGIAAIERKMLAASDEGKLELANEIDTWFEAWVLAEGWNTEQRYDRTVLRASGGLGPLSAVIAQVNGKKEHLMKAALDLKSLTVAFALQDSNLAKKALDSMRERDSLDQTGKEARANQDRELDRRIAEFAETAQDNLSEKATWIGQKKLSGLSRVIP